MLLGHVQGHAHDRRIAQLVPLADALAAGVDPGIAGGPGHAEGHVEGPVLGGVHQGLAHPLPVLGRDAAQHVGPGGDAAAAPAEHDARDVGQVDHVLPDPPLPDAAMGRLHGGAEPALGLPALDLGHFRLVGLAEHDNGQAQADGQRGQQRDRVLDQRALLGGGVLDHRGGGDHQQSAGREMGDAEGLLAGLAAHGHQGPVAVLLVLQQLAEGHAEHLLHRAVRLRLAPGGLRIEHPAVGLHHEGDDRLLIAQRRVGGAAHPQPGKHRVGGQEQQQRQHQHPQGDGKRRRLVIADAG